MVHELVVLHEGAVDDRYAEVDIEQDRHRLKLADDDVAQDADERENALGVRHSPRELAAGTFPFLEQPLERALPNHARHANWMEKDEQPHPRSTETPANRHLLACGHRKRHSL